MVRRRRRRSCRESCPRAVSKKEDDSTVWSITAQGTRDLFSLSPGSTIITSLCDTTFKSIGLATDIDYHDSHVTVTSLWQSCVSIITVRLSNLVPPASVFIQELSEDGNMIDKVQFSTPFADGRLVSLLITCHPDTTIGDRRGKWGMCYVPFRSPEDKEIVRAKFETINLVELAAMPHSVQDSADSTLSVYFNPTLRDGSAFDYQPMDEDMGLLLVVYTLENPEDYAGEPITNHFAPTIAVKARVVCRQPLRGITSGARVSDSYPVIASNFQIHGALFNTSVKFEDCTLISPSVLSIPRAHFERQTGLNKSLFCAST